LVTGPHSVAKVGIAEFHFASTNESRLCRRSWSEEREVAQIVSK
jgi:hypothetical protein